MSSFIILGIIQGLTEFLPISSSGHLYLLKSIFKINIDLLAFFVWLHVATLFALLLFFYREVFYILKRKKIVLNILIATTLTAFVGIGLNVLLDKYFTTHFFLSFAFFITAFLLLWAKNSKSYKVIDDFKIIDSILLGLVQGLAVIPGISRSGITIVALIKRGFKPQEAFRLSFLMAIPVIIGAFLWKSKYILNGMLSPSVLLLGFIFSFLSGLCALMILQKIIKKNFFYVFAYYCIVIGTISIFL